MGGYFCCRGGTIFAAGGFVKPTPIHAFDSTVASSTSKFHSGGVNPVDLETNED
jgi:hypothetical protein